MSSAESHIDFRAQCIIMTLGVCVCVCVCVYVCDGRGGRRFITNDILKLRKIIEIVMNCQ